MVDLQSCVNPALLQGYAEFMVKTALHVQKGQIMLLNSSVETAFFARMCAEEAYKAGAIEVVVFYSDEKFSRIKMENTSAEVLETVLPWQKGRYLDYTSTYGPDKVCVLHIVSSDPEIYKGLDTAKINKAQQVYSKAMRDWYDLVHANKVQWSIAAIPSVAWAAKVFPDMPPQQAVEKLWDAVLTASRADTGRPVQEWETHNANMQRRTAWLNNLGLEAIHMRGENGTDLIVGLPENHKWLGGGENSYYNVYFYANVPTEEVFSAPHRMKVDGVVKSSMPYVYGGNLIKGMEIHFKEGLVVKYTAEEGGELLDQMLSADEGAKRIGEIALVPASSPIRKSGILFYNTLYDENAACHIAFGSSYHSCVEGGENMTAEERLACGLNDSVIHEDVMVGTPGMDIDGILPDGGTVAIFRKGEWVQ